MFPSPPQQQHVEAQVHLYPIQQQLMQQQGAQFGSPQSFQQHQQFSLLSSPNQVHPPPPPPPQPFGYEQNMALTEQQQQQQQQQQQIQHQFFQNAQSFPVPPPFSVATQQLTQPPASLENITKAIQISPFLMSAVEEELRISALEAAECIFNSEQGKGEEFLRAIISNDWMASLSILRAATYSLVRAIAELQHLTNFVEGMTEKIEEMLAREFSEREVVAVLRALKRKIEENNMENPLRESDFSLFMLHDVAAVAAAVVGADTDDDEDKENFCKQYESSQHSIDGMEMLQILKLQDNNFDVQQLKQANPRTSPRIELVVWMMDLFFVFSIRNPRRSEFVRRVFAAFLKWLTKDTQDLMVVENHLAKKTDVIVWCRNGSWLLIETPTNCTSVEEMKGQTIGAAYVHILRMLGVSTQQEQFSDADLNKAVPGGYALMIGPCSIWLADVRPDGFVAQQMQMLGFEDLESLLQVVVDPTNIPQICQNQAKMWIDLLSLLFTKQQQQSVSLRSICKQEFLDEVKMNNRNNRKDCGFSQYLGDEDRDDDVDRTVMTAAAVEPQPKPVNQFERACVSEFVNLLTDGDEMEAANHCVEAWKRSMQILALVPQQQQQQQKGNASPMHDSNDAPEEKLTL